MVGGAVDRRAGDDEALDGAGELLARVVQQGEVVEPGMTARGAGGRLLDELEQVGGARAEHGAGVGAAVNLQADDVLVEGDGAVEVRDGQ